LSVVAIRYKNFMAFQDTGWIELRPICMLFGRNSSGKSSVIRGLRLLKQSLSSDDGRGLEIQDALRFAIKDHLDLGEFRSALHQHTVHVNGDPGLELLKITFAFRCELPDLVTRLWQRILRNDNPQQKPQTEDRPTPKWVELNLEFGYHEQEQAKVVKLVGVHLDCPATLEQDGNRVVFLSADRTSPHGQSNENQLLKETEWDDRWYWASDCYIGDREQNRTTDAPLIDWVNLKLTTQMNFLPYLQHEGGLISAQHINDVRTDFDLVGLTFNAIAKDIRDFLKGIEYLGPIRPEPKRLYTFDRFTMDHWRTQGLGAWLDFITKIDEVGITDWVKKLQLGHAAYAKPNLDVLNLGFQVFIEKAKDKPDNLADVGYGASQVLPVIATCLRAQPGSLIIIEQPELHLHPNAQAELGDLLIQTISKIILEKRNDGSVVPRRIMSGANILIETHSEHLLLRLQRRIAEATAKKSPIEKEVYPKELVFYFVIRQDESSEIVEITFNIFGDILDPSAGFVSFFADDLREITELTRARLSMNSKQKGEGHYG
jgi:hypothetical protein